MPGILPVMLLRPSTQACLSAGGKFGLNLKSTVWRIISGLHQFRGRFGLSGAVLR